MKNIEGKDKLLSVFWKHFHCLLRLSISSFGYLPFLKAFSSESIWVFSVFPEKRNPCGLILWGHVVGTVSVTWHLVYGYCPIFHVLSNLFFTKIKLQHWWDQEECWYIYSSTMNTNFQSTFQHQKTVMQRNEKKNGNKLIFRERKLIGFRTRDEEILMGLVDKINYK